jgi:predicted permease
MQTVSISIPEATVPTFDRVTRTQNDIEEGLSQIAEVSSVGFATGLPLTSSGPSGRFYPETDPNAAPLASQFRFISPTYFETLGTRLVSGRHFERSDYSNVERPVTIVSEGMAERIWGSPSAAVGQRLRRSPNDPWLEIVGVVGDIRHTGLDQPAPETVYLTATDSLAPYMSRSVYYFIRSGRAGTAGFLESVQQTVWSVNPGLPLGSVQTLGDIYQRSMARTSLTLVLLAVSGGMALLLGIVGIYGVISYMVTQRTRELGIRMALGAQNGRLKGMLVGHAMMLVGVGVIIGIGSAAALTRLMESLLFGVAALDPLTFSAVASLLIVTAALAGYLPARRVTGIDPVLALRQD